MERHEKTPVVEALLFASDEPLGVPAIRKVIEDLTPAEIREILTGLKAEYDGSDRGITLIEVAGGHVFVSKESTAPWVEKLMKGKRRVRLSRAALETVAVIAYKQPIGRMEIERIRGVDVGGVLATLLERDLIMIKGRDTGPGKPLLYGTTQEFLNYFGLNKLSDLPHLGELSALAAASPDWSETERARFEKAGVEPIELEGKEPADLALGEGAEELSTEEEALEEPVEGAGDVHAG
jgi:segregation and condensation protein B